jgi:glycosyltransferase involved in cell wall biosynthesis
LSNIKKVYLLQIGRLRLFSEMSHIKNWACLKATARIIGKNRFGITDHVKLLYFSKTSIIGPSSRYRIYQYIPYLREAGFEVTICPLFKEGWFRILDMRWPLLRAAVKAIYALSRLFVRIWDLMKVGRYDLYCFEHQAFPYLPTFLEKIAKRINPNMLLEFDDAIFLTPLHGRKIPKLIAMSQHVIVGNDYLKDYAIKFNPRVSVIPTVVDTERYQAKQGSRTQRQVTIGWIGLAYNLSYLKGLGSVLRRLRGEVGDFYLKIICSQGLTMDGVNTIFKRWSYAGEPGDIRGLDIGIMPLPDDEWARGKCGLKVLQYMACGVPVIASPVGVNKEIIRDGENGFLAAAEKDWLQKLSLLARDEELRRKLGQKGRQTVQDRFSLTHWGPKLASLYKSLQ